MGTRLSRAAGVLNDTIADLRHNLAELHLHTQISSEPLPDMLQNLANDPHYNSMVKISLNVKLPKSKVLSSRRVNHVAAIVTEALSNTVRHAQAKEVCIEAQGSENNLVIEIQDDGIGLPEDLRMGYGLRNMRDRARLLNGTISCIKNNGTLILLEIPWVDEKL
jgi:signal transduction histidine kinase